MQGGASVLIILIMISLTTFGVLALVSAHSDLKLARKNAAFVQEYYDLEAEAEFKLHEVEEALGEGASDRELAQLGWQVQLGDVTMLRRDVSKGLRHIAITLELTPNRDYKLVSWVQTQEQFEYSAGEKLWDGKVIEDQ